MKDQTRLEKLVNKSFIYKQEHIRIKDYFMKEEEGTVHIVTDKTPITIKDSEIQQFIDRCLPVEEEVPGAITVVTEARQTITSLKDILMDNITKVQANKDYIQQANTINNSVNSLLTMVSLQMKLTNKRQG